MGSVDLDAVVAVGKFLTVLVPAAIDIARAAVEAWSALN